VIADTFQTATVGLGQNGNSWGKLPHWLVRSPMITMQATLQFGIGPLSASDGKQLAETYSQGRMPFRYEESTRLIAGT
jgi:hypothetical protein